MIRIEDCVSGVEVVCIDTLNISSAVPMLVKGGVYTIKARYPGYIIFPLAVMDPCISLQEIAPFRCDNCNSDHEWIYTRNQFKLHKRQELRDIFKVEDSKLPVLEDA